MINNASYEKNGISYCFSTYKNEWVSCPIKELPKIGAGIGSCNYSNSKNPVKYSFKIHKKRL